MRLIPFVLILLQLTAYPVLAQYGTVDDSFGVTGYAVPIATQWDELGNGMALNSSGEILLYGTIGTTSHITGKLNSVGADVTSYGTNGFQQGYSSGSVMVVTNGLIQIDDKLIVIGHGYAGSSSDHEIQVARYQTDGTLDTDFGTSGHVLVNPTVGRDQSGKAVLLADGSVVIAGTSDISGSSNLMLVKLNSSGVLDATFGIGGVAIHSTATIDVGYDVTTDSQGRYVLVGTRYDTNAEQLMVRFLADGTLDATFGSNGEAAVTPANTSEFKDVAVQLDGKYVACGKERHSNGNDSITVTRFNTDGTLDNSFANNGFFRRDMGLINYADDIIILPDGSILIGGSFQDFDWGYQFQLTHLNADGSVDQAFGVNGTATAGYYTFDEYFAEMKLDAQGGILMAGKTNFSSDKFLVTRIDFTGTPTSIIEDEKSLLGLYPNPNSGSFTLKWDDKNEISHLHLVDMSGRILKSYQVGNSGTIQISEHVSPGAYILSAIFNDGSIQHQRMSVVN